MLTDKVVMEAKFRKAPLEDVLDHLLINLPLTYKMINDSPDFDRRKRKCLCLPKLK